jgi:hypothetical protein
MFWRVDDTTNGNRWNAYYNLAGGSRGVDGYNTAVAQGSFPMRRQLQGPGKLHQPKRSTIPMSLMMETLKTLDVTWSPPTVTRFVLGQGAGAIRWDRQIKYYPARVTDTQLQLLTQ